MREDKDIVLLHKKTGKLSYLIEGAFFGDIIVYGPLPEEKVVNKKTPWLFDDDPKFNLEDYEALGQL